MARTLAELTDPAAVQAALDEFLRLGQSAFLERYGYRRASGYIVRDPRSGQWADSKAIAGVAVGVQHPYSGPLKPSEFSGGTSTVVRSLERLGFEVRALDSRGGDDWSRDELELIVSDYLSMLLQELAGQAFNKTVYQRRLRQALRGRSQDSIQFKHANISAAMLELGYPYLRAYQPRSNCRRGLLVDVVQRQVRAHQALDEAAIEAAERLAAPIEHAEFAKVLQRAPMVESSAHETEPAYLHSPIKRDYLAREAHNRSLGKAGVLFALQFERWRLAELGAGQLAEKVRHVSVEDGDGLGYDIHSFDINGADRFIEVKTTTFGERTPFFVSANEAQFARSQATAFRLYRLYEFRSGPRMFELAGAIEQHCRLDAATYRATFG